VIMHTLTIEQKQTMITTLVTDQPTQQQVTPELQAQERTWARAAQQGDQDAFMCIVDAYQRPVYNLCYRMLGDAGEAEDAAQETFLRAYTKLKTYNPNRKFSSWILSIASHYCIDRLRRKRHQLVSWDELPAEPCLPTNEPEPEEATLAHENRDTIHNLLDTLSPDYRAVIVLRYWHEMAYDEIATTLDTTVSTIKSRLFRARQMMAKQYELCT